MRCLIILIILFLVIFPLDALEGEPKINSTEYLKLYPTKPDKIHTLSKGERFIFNFEGVVESVYSNGKPKDISFELDTSKYYVAYRDPKNLWTHGIGHLLPQDDVEARERKLSALEVQDLFTKDMKKYEDLVNQEIKIHLTQNQFNALVSFAFNLGETNFRKAYLVGLINTGEAEPWEITRYFKYWKDGGLLLSRRNKEAKLYNSIKQNDEK